MVKFEPIVERMKTAIEGSINTSELLELMQQVEDTRQREIAAKEREDRLKAHFNMEAADSDVAIGKYGETVYVTNIIINENPVFCSLVSII